MLKDFPGGGGGSKISDNFRIIGTQAAAGLLTPLQKFLDMA